MHHSLRLITTAMVALLLAQPAAAQDSAKNDLMTEDQAFNAVFENPADLILNFQLVAAQLRNNNFKGAAATLERILTLSKDNSQAQTLLVNTQFRLGNIAEARRIAQLVLDNPNATTEQRKNIETLLDRIDEAEKLFDLNGVVSLGGGVTDNVEGASIGNDAVASDTFEAGGYSKRRSVREFTNLSTSFNVTGKFLSQLPENFTLGFSAARRNVKDYGLGDTDSLGINGRYLKTFSQTQVTTGGSATAVSVDGRRYLENYNLFATARHILYDQYVASATASNTWSVYHNSFDRTVSGNGLLSLRNGQARNLTLRLTRSFDWFQLGTTVAAGNTEARASHNEKRNTSAGVDASFAVLGGIASVGLNHSKVKHKGPDSRYFSTVKRRDFTNTVTASYSIGLGKIFQLLEQQPRLSFSARYGKTKSNIANFSKYTGEGQILLIQPF